MAKFQDTIRYFSRYHWITLFSVGMMSLFEIIDLFVPYAIGQSLCCQCHNPSFALAIQPTGLARSVGQMHLKFTDD